MGLRTLRAGCMAAHLALHPAPSDGWQHNCQNATAWCTTDELMAEATQHNTRLLATGSARQHTGYISLAEPGLDPGTFGL